ncbi:hypothetical protein [Herpetosiphon gulosus]|uniref:Uncharacterized protein n=1 Tax=Herpetosiphon gulosus TaxID=1973496 RepID=A0ABP9X9I4_9CHLR
MDFMLFIRIITFPFIFILLLIWTPKIKQNRNGISVVHKLFFGAVCFLIGAISAFPDPVIPWLHLIGIAAMHYAILSLHMAADHLINNKRYIPILKNKVFIITTVLTIATLVVDYIRRDNLQPFIDFDVKNRIPIYYLGEILHFLTLFYLGVITIRMYVLNFLNAEVKNFSIRVIAGFLTFLVGAVSSGLVMAGLIVSILYGDENRTLFTTFYHYSKIIILILIIIGFAMPQSLVRLIAHPLEQRQAEKKNGMNY